MSSVLSWHPTCQQVVERMTDYLEGALPAADRDHFELHLTSCAACVTYWDQLQASRQALAALRHEPASSDQTERLVAVFRAWKEDR